MARWYRRLQFLLLSGVIVVALNVLVPDTRNAYAIGSQQFDFSQLPACVGGLNRVPTPPPPGPIVPGCIAKPSHVTPHPLGKRQLPPGLAGRLPEGPPAAPASRRVIDTPRRAAFRLARLEPFSGGFHRPVARSSRAWAGHAGYHFVHLSTSYLAYTTSYGALQVQNPDLSQTGNPSFVATWYMLVTADQSHWNQVGWSENSWTGDYRHVFAFSTNYSVWLFFDDYTLIDGETYHFSVSVGLGGIYWTTAIWWNGQWNILTWDYALGPKPYQAAQAFEAYSATGADATIGYTEVSDSRLQTSPDGPLFLWDSSISTYGSIASPYCRYLPDPYYNWAVWSC